MSTHNIYFLQKNNKIDPELSPNTPSSKVSSLSSLPTCTGRTVFDIHKCTMPQFKQIQQTKDKIGQILLIFSTCTQIMHIGQYTLYEQNTCI